MPMLNPTTHNNLLLQASPPPNNPHQNNPLPAVLEQGDSLEIQQL